jgi:hypothetical protein
VNKSVLIGSLPLTLEQMRDVARYDAPAVLAVEAQMRIAKGASRSIGPVRRRRTDLWCQYRRGRQDRILVYFSFASLAWSSSSFFFRYS